MSDLIHLRAFARASVKLVRQIQDETAFRADVPIAVDDPIWNGDLAWRRLTDDEFHPVIEGRGVCAVVPEDDHEIRRTKEAEAVGLPGVLMRPSRNTWQGHRCIGHCGERPSVGLILAIEFHQPATGVAMCRQGGHHYACDR